jgi:hypothetical protein
LITWLLQAAAAVALVMAAAAVAAALVDIVNLHLYC